MEIIKLIEGLRTPFWDEFFSVVTRFGEETLFIVIGFILFWCVDKKKGYYLILVCFWGLLFNQVLKITCRVPRPWIKDPTFTIVESAKEEATGFSFPSGHTQISVGTYGSLGRMFKNIALRIVCIVLCVLVPFSRLYLGVHTVWDVAFSVVVALVLVFVMYPLVDKAMNSKNGMRWIFGSMVAAAAAYLLYVEFLPFKIDEYNMKTALDYAYKILGLTVGAWAGYELDRKFVNFDTKAPVLIQLLKYIPGLLLVLLIKEGLKMPLEIVFGEYVGGGVRYFLITLFACGIWPMSFKYLKKIGNKKEQ